MMTVTAKATATAMATTHACFPGELVGTGLMLRSFDQGGGILRHRPTGNDDGADPIRAHREDVIRTIMGSAR